MYEPETLIARDSDSLALLSADREQVAKALCLHFAADNIAMATLEDRLSRVYVAQSAGDLRSLLADLPALAGASRGPQRQRVAVRFEPACRNCVT